MTKYEDKNTRFSFERKFCLENLKIWWHEAQNLFYSAEVLHEFERFYDGKFYRTEHIAEIEQLAKEVIMLKEKLGEDVYGGGTAVVLFYGQYRAIEAGLRPPSREEEIQTAQQKYAELQAHILQRQASHQ